jgi:hypothetical protein
MNNYPEVDKYFKTLYYRNQDWFKYRNQLNDDELHNLFQAFIKMGESLNEISRVFDGKKI